MKKFKRKSMTRNRNLVCKKRRWLGQKPQCRQSRPTTQQCEADEAAKCEQLCIKHDNETEATCYCHKGFRLIGSRCFGELLADSGRLIKHFIASLPLQTSTSVPSPTATSVAMESASTRPDPSTACANEASDRTASANAWVSEAFDQFSIVPQKTPPKPPERVVRRSLRRLNLSRIDDVNKDDKPRPAIPSNFPFSGA